MQQTASTGYTTSDSFEPSPQLLSAPAGDETVLLDLEDGSYFGLDRVGASVWAGLNERLTFGELTDAMCRTYRVDRCEAEVDLARFLKQLQESDLISVVRERETGAHCQGASG